jgi:hypothetical protein
MISRQRFFRKNQHNDHEYTRARIHQAETRKGMLPQCTALTELDLSFNEIGIDGANTLAGVLPQAQRWLTFTSVELKLELPEQ